MAGTIIKQGDTVVFRAYGKVATGTLTSFERDGNGKVTGATITVEGDPVKYGVAWNHLALAGSPVANGWLNPPKHLPMGTVVRATYPAKERGKVYGGVAHGDIGVVLQDKGDRVNIAKLGSSGRDQYARLPHSHFQVVSDWSLQADRYTYAADGTVTDHDGAYIADTSKR